MTPRPPDTIITPADAAAILRVTATRVRAMIAAGQIPAKKLGREWMIRAADLDAVRDRRPGRPAKS